MNPHLLRGGFLHFLSWTSSCSRYDIAEVIVQAIRYHVHVIFRTETSLLTSLSLVPVWRIVMHGRYAHR